MNHFKRQPRWAISLMIIQLAGCAATAPLPDEINTGKPSVETPATEIPSTPPAREPSAVTEEPAHTPTIPPPVYSDAQTTTHPAVLALLSEATAQESGGDLEVAAAKLERALRIEPRNAVLWHHLAAIRLRQGKTQLAMSLAQKSNSFAARDADLMERNQRIIDQAHQRN